jgi:hypothetical protein
LVHHARRATGRLCLLRATTWLAAASSFGDGSGPDRIEEGTPIGFSAGVGGSNIRAVSRIGSGVTGGSGATVASTTTVGTSSSGFTAGVGGNASVAAASAGASADRGAAALPDAATDRCSAAPPSTAPGSISKGAIARRSVITSGSAGLPRPSFGEGVMVGTIWLSGDAGLPGPGASASDGSLRVLSGGDVPSCSTSPGSSFRGVRSASTGGGKLRSDRSPNS